MAVIKEIYVHLLEESASRPTEAIELEPGIFQLLPTPDYDSEEEIWEFLPGSVVKCEQRNYEGRQYLQAIEQVQ